MLIHSCSVQLGVFTHNYLIDASISLCLLVFTHVSISCHSFSLVIAFVPDVVIVCACVIWLCLSLDYSLLLCFYLSLLEWW